MFLDLERPEVGESQPPSVELCGALTGRQQRRYYSSKRALILELHSDSWQSNSTGFTAQYRFVDKCKAQRRDDDNRLWLQLRFDRGWRG